MVRTAYLFGFLAVATQRLGYTSAGGGSFQLTTVVLLATVAWSVARGHTRVRTWNVLLFASLVVSVCVVSLVDASLNALPLSIMSLVFFLLTYTTILTAGGSRAVDVGRHFFVGAVSAMKLGAVLGVVQFVAQRAGLGFLDPMRALPAAWLRTGFNTYYALKDAPGFKPNGVIFLEPSFLSLYAALGLVVVIGSLFGGTSGETVRRHLAWIAVLLAGVAVSASASGLVVIGAAGLPLLFAVKRNRAVLLVLATGIAVAAGAGAFGLVYAKASEGFRGNTSSALRLTLPYELLTPYWLQRPVLGWGPGTATATMAEIAVPGLQASTVMKLLVEYGLVTAFLLGASVWLALRGGGAPRYLVFAVLAAWILPAEALLNSTLVLLLMFSLANWHTPTAPTGNEAVPGGPPEDALTAPGTPRSATVRDSSQGRLAR